MSEALDMPGAAAAASRRRETERLGSDPIVPLVLRLSVPALVGLLASSLYTFVDRVFIGNYVGEIGLAAMNAAIPFNTLIFAFSILIGRGCAVLYSLALGRRDYAGASRVFAQGITLDLIAAAVLVTCGLAFLRPVLTLFGAPAMAMAPAADYMSVLLLGTPFALLTMHNHLIRAEGASTYAMATQIVGGVLNVLLDWLFMGGLGLGMRGAAAATVISQAVSVALVMAFFARRSVIRFRMADMALRAKLVWQVVVNGATPFIFNFAATLNWSIRNHMIQKYAEPSGHELGAAMASFGVVMTVYHVAMTPTVGFAMGMQPLVGYNMGARHYRRVRRIFLTSLVLAWLLLMVPFLGLEVFARPVFRMFGAEGDALSLGVYTLRRYVSLLPFGGVCVLFAHYFQGTGQAGRALLISSVRQIFLALPLMVLMPVWFGYDGIIFAFPVSELIGMLFAAGLMAFEHRRLRQAEEAPPLPTAGGDPAAGAAEERAIA